MCKKEIYMLSIANRGTNLVQSVGNQTYEVNLPSNLRRQEECMLTVKSASVAFPLTDARELLELSISTDLPILGFDTEVNSGFMSRNYNKLFSVTLPNISDSYPQFVRMTGNLTNIGSNGTASTLQNSSLVNLFNDSAVTTQINTGLLTFKLGSQQSMIVRKKASFQLEASTANIYANSVEDSYNWVGNLDNSYTCRCGSLPEKFRFSRVANTTANTISSPSIQDNYISFTLIIEYLNDENK